MVTDKQVKTYRNLLTKGQPLETAALKAGMTPKTARSWRTGPMPSEIKAIRGPRTWRTRKDPFAEHWEALVLPQLEADEEGILEASFLFEYLRELEPDGFPEASLRTFQRRVADYRAVRGPSKEIFFPQVYRPGEMAQLDFTHISQLGVTIRGQALKKLLFECVLCFSGRRHVALVPSESYEALNVGVQGAFLAWGGSPKQVVQDHVTAAVHNLKAEGQDRYRVSARYESVLAHYGAEPRFIEVAKPNQNGCVERGHGVLKSLIRQALKLRRSSDFASALDFERFVLSLVERLNRRRQDRWEEERKHLNPLPRSLPNTYTELVARVSRWSLIQVRGNTISVPARLIGLQVKVRLHLDKLEIFYKDQLVDTLVRPVGRGLAVINYRHLVSSLVRKPGAFANYRYHEQMFPTLNFRKAYDALKSSYPTKAAQEYLRILKLAADHLECDVDSALQLHFEEKLPINFRAIEELVVRKTTPSCLELPTVQPDLKRFDNLLSGETREQLAA